MTERLYTLFCVYNTPRNLENTSRHLQLRQQPSTAAIPTTNEPAQSIARLAPMPTLATLPEELCIAIVEELDIASFIQLSQTNRLFRRLCDINVPRRREEAKAFYNRSPFELSRALWYTTLRRCYVACKGY